jgi:ATP-dependent protease HslVU (ClpYQ) ATPase subunit
MALTAEQQAEIQLEIDKNKFRLEAELAAGIVTKEAEREIARRSHEIAIEQKRNKMELVRLAKEVLVENNRSKPVDSRDISADDITDFAQSLINYVDGEQ